MYIMKNKNGFNLVELTVALGVSAIVGLGVMTLVSNLQKSSKKLEQDFAVSEMKFLVLKAMTQPKHCVANWGGLEVTPWLSKPDSEIFSNDLYLGTTTVSSTNSMVYSKSSVPLLKMFRTSYAQPKKDTEVGASLYYRYGEGDGQFRVSYIGLSNLKLLRDMEMKIMSGGIERVVKAQNATVNMSIKYTVGENVVGENKIKDKKAKQVIEQKFVLPLTLRYSPNGKRVFIHDCGYQGSVDSVACNTLGGELYKQGNNLECKSIAIRKRSISPHAIKAESDASALEVVVSNNALYPSRITAGATQLCPTGSAYCQGTINEFKSPVSCKTKATAPGGVRVEDCVVLGTMSGDAIHDSKRVTDFLEFWVNSVTGDPEYDRVKREIEIQFIKDKKVRQCTCRQNAQSRGSCTVLGAPDASGWVKIKSDSYTGCSGPVVEGGPGAPGYFIPPQSLETRDCNGDAVVDGGYRKCSFGSTETDAFNCQDVCGGNGDTYIPCDKSGSSGLNYCEVTGDNRHDIFRLKAGDLYVGDSFCKNYPTVCKVKGDLDIYDHMTIRKMFYDSDLILKDNVKDLSLGDAKKVLNITGVSFDWKRNNQHDLGVVVQEVEKYFPEITHRNEKLNVKTLETEKLIAPLIEMIKENERVIASQKSRIKDINRKLKHQP
ncbi:MAG: hypothetical protein A2381_02960 [Bdellovibrionales bacterium RIFOXYB1_FULL_37_110]|nr:MAG: hypothetical protein A2181_03340 [Bdellovibrionales bacterium RIFOXYA1_FULL_38_20]OFZ51466.1 MAG: hypothetical protein A2417_09415 [Bdellovibrionales bacterium RIFOXYC1_FULL_37_79]OFZ57894.1 MAG: hypothetical protein A2381_02960 [Bdellovibrionales bacterium RIFOXYB1_FULL_37_110]OFZ63620.1 MAG: hypothetical protein A2577_05260 [Bdellovibrionales bacterium RIFOXYD1_FULL_36_51]